MLRCSSADHYCRRLIDKTNADTDVMKDAAPTSAAAAARRHRVMPMSGVVSKPELLNTESVVYAKP